MWPEMEEADTSETGAFGDGGGREVVAEWPVRGRPAPAARWRCGAAVASSEGVG